MLLSALPAILSVISCKTAERGPGFLIEVNKAGEPVVAAPTYDGRLEAIRLSAARVEADQATLEILRKAGGTVMVDAPAAVTGLEGGTTLLDMYAERDAMEALKGYDEKVAIDLLRAKGVRVLLLHRSLRASFDRDSRVISRLYNHDALEQVQLVRVLPDLMVYLLDPPAAFPPNLAEASIRWLRASLSGENPAPFPAIKPERGQWILIVTVRGQGHEAAVSLADGKTLDLALAEAAKDLEMVHRRYREIDGFPSLDKAIQGYTFEIHRVSEMAAVGSTDEAFLESLWEMGIDGAIIQQIEELEDGRIREVKEGALPGSASPARGIRTADEFLRATAKQFRFDSIRPWRDDSTRLYLTRTASYREVRPPGAPPTVAPMYRGTLPVPMELVTQETVRESIVMMGEWYLANLQPDGSIIYKFWPEENRFSTEYNHVRHELGTWNLWQAWTLDPRPEFLEGAKRVQDWTLKSLVDRDPARCAAGEKAACFEAWEEEFLATHFDKELQEEIRREGVAYFNYGDNSKLGSVVVGLMGMIDLARATGDHSNDALMRDLGRFTLMMQRKEGGFTGYHVPPGHSYYMQTNDIVPGEAALALIMLYEYFNDPRYLSTLQTFFDYYKPWFAERAAKKREGYPWPAYTYDNQTRLELVQFGPWTVMAADAYTRVRPEADDVAKLGLDVGRWMVETYQYRPQHSPFPDYVGGYYKYEGELPAMQAFCYAEGTAAAYSMALREAPDQAAYFEEATRRSLRFAMQMQHDAFDTYSFSRPWLAFGGVKYAMNEPKIRIDYTYHAQSSLYQWLMASRRDPNLPEMAKAGLQETQRLVMGLMGAPSFRAGPLWPDHPSMIPAEAQEKQPEKGED